ncbi:hypothetical protein RB12265 [Rhodopirellula baltica SH 1]|uniref:Uncharacterized protein n=1 Tax=Rhodopirellula baltica (strain DSM 10527 / NCIMB 13988 / SH1) TaxID=243090 RepID=Q7UIX9_RHOBA|nr:hypothetical protein RB12265 [Rhodopirellula baltica SH 1]
MASNQPPLTRCGSINQQPVSPGSHGTNPSRPPSEQNKMTLPS